MTTREIVEPILKSVYGTGPMVEACAKDLADLIDGYPGERRQHAVMLRCWDWFSGGSTAESVASEIEDALASGRERP